LKLPVANLRLFQALLYKLLPPELSTFLHDEGYRVDGRPMKLFAMSWPLSATRPRESKGKIEYDLPVRLVVSTPVLDALDGFVGGAFKNEELHIGNTSVVCEGVEAMPLTVTSEEVHVKTLSPITCYSQMQRGDGRKYTVYFHPSSPDFSESIHNNLVKKFRAFYPGEDPQLPEGRVEIRPVGRIQERVAKFDERSNFPIKGWEGEFASVNCKNATSWLFCLEYWN
jgi:CRISPR-associated endoribonuclease Cas6